MKHFSVIVLALFVIIAIAQTTKTPRSVDKTYTNVEFASDSFFVTQAKGLKIYPAFINRGPGTIAIAACRFGTDETDTVSGSLLVPRLDAGQPYNPPNGCFANYFRIKVLSGDSASVGTSVPVRE